MDCSNVTFPSDCKGVGEISSKIAERANVQMQTDLAKLMHGKPAYWLLGSCFVFFSVASWFMDTYIASSTSCVAVFVLGSYNVMCSYFLIHYFMDKLSSSYKNLEHGKQFYVLSNLIKSAALCAYSPIAAKLCYDALYEDNWNTRRIRNMGCMYAITDFVSMIMVRRMAWSTTFHHICVCLFAAFSCYNDYGEENVARMIFVYAIFSVFSYLVNLLLASRFFLLSKKASTVLSAAALVIYATCCSINWTWQVYYGIRLFNLLEDRTGLGVYTFLIVFIVTDDLKLMSWLYGNVMNKVADDDASKQDKKGKIVKKVQ